MDQNIVNEMISELKKLNIKDSIWTKDVEKRIVKMIENNDQRIQKSKGKIVWEIYEELRMKQSIDKVNVIAKQNEKNPDKQYVKKHSRIGRIDRKKALLDLIGIVKKNGSRFDNHIMQTIDKIESKMQMPDDFDVNLTAKIRDDFVYLMNGKINFHTIVDGKETKKSIKLIDNSIIFIGKNYILRFDIDKGLIEDDRISVLGVMPQDSIYYTVGNLVFVFRLWYVYGTW